MKNKEQKLKVKHIKKYEENNFAWIVYLIFFLFGYAAGYSVFYFLSIYNLMSEPLKFFCAVLPVVYAVGTAVDLKDNFKFTSESIEHQEVKK